MAKKDNLEVFCLPKTKKTTMGAAELGPNGPNPSIDPEEAPEVLTLEDLARLKSGLKRSHRRPSRNLRNVHQRSHRSRYIPNVGGGGNVQTRKMPGISDCSYVRFVVECCNCCKFSV